MANISVETAAGAGFKLIGQRPLSVFVWGLFVVLVMYIPAITIAASVIPSFLAMAREVQANPTGGPPFAQLAALFRPFGTLNAIMGPIGLIVGSILSAAVYRAVLQPKNVGFAYLRLGASEIWLFVLSIAQGLLWFVLLLMTVISVGLLATLTYRFVAPALGVLVGLVAGLGSIYLLIVLALRLSMAGPMTFTAKEFRLFQSWRLTRGHAGSLFLVALLVFVIVMGLGLLIGVVERIALLPLFFSLVTDPHGMDRVAGAFQGSPSDWAVRYWPYLLVGAVVMALSTGIMRAVLVAPWAAVYRMLKADGDGTAQPAVQPVSLSLD